MSYADIDRSDPPPSTRGGRDSYRDGCPRTRSRSPGRSGQRGDRYDRRDRYDRHDRSRRNDNFGGRDHAGRSNGVDSRRSRELSVSERGDPIPDAHKSWKNAEIRRHDTQQDNAKTHSSNGVTTSIESTNGVGTSPNETPVVISTGEYTESAIEDEAALEALRAEKRRKREAIKAKHKGQSAPLLPQVLLGNGSDSNTPNPDTPGNRSERSVSPMVTSPGTPLQDSTPDSPAAFIVDNDEGISNHSPAYQPINDGDGPSAADYDPTMDMEEDRARQNQKYHQEDVSAADYDETKPEEQRVLLPEPEAEEPKSTQHPKSDFDMFAEDDDDDMFAPEPKTNATNGGPSKAVPIPKARELDQSLLDNWDDADGYYKVYIGELLDGRYHVQASLGKGMFSGVVRATDNNTGKLVAIKIIRNNEIMKKAGLKEVEILKQLTEADPDDRKHLIRLERHFEHKGHLCMVFENLSMNLRELLKKVGGAGGGGITLEAVRFYAHQMFLGLSLLKKSKILHADLKPDNILVNETQKVLKICDLGSAANASESNEITPYLVSRFYRAPEIILGMPFEYPIDMWSVGCTLFELWTGKILFTGRSNNQMLRSIMECRGKFSLKMLKKGQCAADHFNDKLDFRSVEKDKFGKDVVRWITFIKPTRDLKSRIADASKGLKRPPDPKQVNLFADLLDQCLHLNPERRITPTDALKHPFLQTKF